MATGTVTTNNNTTIGSNFTLISAGLITIANGTTIGSKGLLYSNTGFSVGNNFVGGAAGAGNGITILSPGDFTATWTNGATIYGFIYCGGTLTFKNNTNFTGNIVASYVSDVGNNSHLTLNASSTNFNGVQGLTGATKPKISSWQEVY
ncbi:MAG: hypothetical protein NT099_08615 [Candidatus Saganbacteria bacterium]|nr:hypothetical protein [Candidatus Saganbacteria bacterium]